MTVSSELSKQTFNCDGVSRAFTCPFGVLDSSELQGYLITISDGTSEDLTNGVDYVVSAVGEANAVATTATAYSSLYQVKFVRRTSRLQLVDYRDNDPFPAESHEGALDRLTHIAQEQDSLIDRALKLPEPETAASLPAIADRIGKLLGFGSDGQPIAVAATTDSAAALELEIKSSGLDLLRVGDPTMFGYPGDDVARLYRDGGTPVSIQHTLRVITKTKGDNTTYRGCTNAYFEIRDRDDVDATNKGVGYALHLSVVPNVTRNNVPYDDMVGLTIGNTTGAVGAKATDAIYISENPFAFGDHSTGTSEWYSIFTADCNADVGIVLAGKITTYGIDLKSANFPTSAAIRLGNAQNIYWRNAANSSDLRVIGLDSNNTLQIGETNTGGIVVNAWFGTTTPVSVAATTYTVLNTDNFLTFNVGAGCTVTLPAAASFPKRILQMRNVSTGAVISASSNVVALAGGAAGTAILAGTAGKWARLVSDGAVWQIMEAA